MLILHIFIRKYELSRKKLCLKIKVHENEKFVYFCILKKYIILCLN